MYKLDLEPLAPRLLKNRDAHIGYIKHTQTQADILRGIVEQAKALKPLDNLLDYACKYTKHIQELFVYVSKTCPKPSEKLVADTPLNKTKKVSTSTQTTSSDTQDSNKPELPSTGVICSTHDSGLNPTGNTKKDRITQPSSSNIKNKVEGHARKVGTSLKIKTNRVSHSICPVNDTIDPVIVQHASKKTKNRKVWKPTGKLFTKVGLKWKPIGNMFNDIGLKWRPTGRTFTIDGNRCPVTRITSTNIVPPRETTITSVETPILNVKVNKRRPKTTKSRSSKIKSKAVDSKIANNLEPNKSWGSAISNVPSSLKCRLYKLFFGLGHNLFFVGQFCDSDLEVAFRKHTCFYDLEGVDLLKGSRGSNLYTIYLEIMMQSYPICLLSKASKTKSWLWHRRLSHLNFDYITTLAKHLPKLKYQKDHLCSACALGKSKRHSHKPKADNTIQEKLYLLHMDLCGPMRIQSINGRKYILVIVDDYSRFTWVKFLRSKDEVPEFVINFLKMIQVCLKATVRNIRTDNGTEFVNQTLRANYEDVEISHQTLAPLFIWAEAVATACYTQIRSLIRKCHNKTPYELLHDQKPDLSYLHVFGALCYPTNDSEDLGKLKPKADIRIFVGYAPSKKAYQIYNKRTRLITETIHVGFDELTAMASEQFSSGPMSQLLTPGTISSGLVSQPPSSTPIVPPTQDEWNLLFQPMFDEYFKPPPSVDHPVPKVHA
ncbi:retrovirus-related pol polyprotein from transposon TNT 1-94 [Tanacetum coccineum]